jgi:hypothetical protein
MGAVQWYGSLWARVMDLGHWSVGLREFVASRSAPLEGCIVALLGSVCQGGPSAEEGRPAGGTLGGHQRMSRRSR